MKRKELAKYIDQMSDCIDGLEIEPRLKISEIEPDKPYTSAIEMMVDTISLIIDHRAKRALKDGDAND